MSHYTSLARLAVETFVKEGKVIEPPKDLPEKFFKERSGVFVTIYTKYKILNTKYELRGCIGTYLPTRKNIAQEIVRNAIAAAAEDYRFGSIQKEELPYLTYTVYILSKPELVLIKKASDPPKFFFEKLGRAGLDPKKYGIIVKTAPIGLHRADVVFNGHVPYKSGLLLPDLDGIETVEKQILIACQKGGIDLTKEKIIIYRFTVEKYQ